MATAYAAIVSLIHLIDEQIPIYIARRPTIFSKKQLEEIKYLKEKACFVQDHLESHSHKERGSNETQDLERRIVDASYAAADVIESHIVNDIMDQEKETVFQSCVEATLHVSEVVQKVIQDVDYIAKEMLEIEDLHPNNLTPVDHSLRPQYPSMNDHDTMVGFDDRLTQIMDKLTGQQPTLQIIPITGMGGIGKTTLARNVYGNLLIVQRFDIRGWITVSQFYNIEQMLLGLLRGVGVTIDQMEQENSEYHHLGKILYQHLSGRMYLIIVDDLWNTDVWDKLKVFFPDTQGSRIMVTTRLKDVANYVGSSNLHEINLLDENKSWSLLCRKVFGQEGCPRSEMEEVGRKIAKNCQGLPLSIVVIGGLLVASKMTLDTWEYVADNINKIMSSEDSDCLDILLLSYKHLPIHLQPCFLYIGVYPEDHIIRASELINLWVAEGLIKPSELKTLEEVAGEYLKDLIERHLIMVNERGSLGTMKTCTIHDLLRDLCLREAHKEKFLLVDEVDKLQDSSQFIIEHRVAIQHKIYVSPSQQAFKSTLLVRSLTCKCEFELPHIRDFKLLRVFNVLDEFCKREFDINLLNLRFMRLSLKYLKSVYLVHLLWNLQTLVIHDTIREKPFTLQIWKMPHLRHLICTWHHYIRIPDPQHDLIDDSVLENLQTISGIQSFKCTEEVVRRIPNVKKLVIVYNPRSIETGSHNYLKNIGCLHKLQSLTLRFTYGYKGEEYIQNCVFPHSLKKLALIGSDNHTLEDIIKRTGWLPHLEKLKLKYIRSGEDWNPVEGQFLRLKVLKLKNMYNLEYLRAESTHFPVLEHLHLKSMYSLKEISSGIGEIATLQSITLKECEASVVASAKYIMDEQQSFGNEGLRLASS